MPTPAETAERFGVRPEQLPDLLELPQFAEALASAQADPNLSIQALIVAHKLPTRPKATITDPDALDVEKLHAEAVSARLRRERLEDVGRRGDGTSRSPERVEGSGVMLGKMQKAEKRVQKLYGAIERIDTLLLDTTNNGMPAVSNLNAARKVAKEALK
jgi:hypothetical protein